MVAVKSLPNGYIRIIYVLGNKEGNQFINHKSHTLIPDPLKSKTFDTYKKAMEFNQENKNKYLEELFVYQFKVTVEKI